MRLFANPRVEPPRQSARPESVGIDQVELPRVLIGDDRQVGREREEMLQAQRDDRYRLHNISLTIGTQHGKLINRRDTH